MAKRPTEKRPRKREPMLDVSFEEMNRRFLYEISEIAGEIERRVQESGLRDKVRQIRDLARQITANQRAGDSP